MKYKLCSIRINVTKFDVTFATKGWSFILLHAYLRITPAPSCTDTNKNFILLIEQAGITAYLWL